MGDYLGIAVALEAVAALEQLLTQLCEVVVGPYLLIAAKCGYTPDFHIIKITDNKLRPEPMRADLAPMNVEESEAHLIK